MLRHKSISSALCCLVVIAVCAAMSGPAQALTQRGISLTRNPAPPSAILNDGTGNIRFDWVINYATICQPSITLEIIPPIGAPFTILTRPCSASEIVDNYTWNVPAGTSPGCYYARVSFNSNWCNGTPSKLEDQALVAFIIAPAGRLKLCKFLDINGNGSRLPSDPPLSGWTFKIYDSQIGGNLVATAVTGGLDGCTPEITVPITNGTLQQTYWVEEVPPDAQPWQRTTPNPGAPSTRFPVVINAGVLLVVDVGNWVPIIITGRKLLDIAPWPWGLGDNPVELEPYPDCTPPASCPISALIPGIQGVTIELRNGNDLTLLDTKLSDANGNVQFAAVHYVQNYRLTDLNPAAVAPICPTFPEQGGLTPWPGAFVSTVAESIWPCPTINFATPDVLDITLPPPATAFQVYPCNNFFNRQPSRLWGLFCEETVERQSGPNPPLPNRTVLIEKDQLGSLIPWPAGNPSFNSGTGFYVVESLPQEPIPSNNIRPGEYIVKPPVPSDLDKFQWKVTVYCDDGSGQTTFTIPGDGQVSVTVPSGTDVRVDFCLEEKPVNKRCYIPVTFTQDGWSTFCSTTNPILPNFVYSKFGSAFKNFKFYDGVTYHNKMLIGKKYSMTWEGTTGGLERLCIFLPQTGPCGKISMNYLNPWAATPAGALAGEVAALQMNIAWNDKRLMPRTPGYDIECFTLASGLLKGKRVGQVLDIANAVLGGDPPCSYGVPDCASLVAILQAINANYEFVDYNTFNDRGYLIPNRGFGPPDPPHDPQVPFVPCGV